jgi:hypothetical protein
MQAGIKVGIVFEDTPSEEDTVSSYMLDIVAAKVIYRKNSASISKPTIKPMRMGGFKTLTQKNLTLGLKGMGEIECTFGNGSSLTSSQTPYKGMYTVDDLVFLCDDL